MEFPNDHNYSKEHTWLKVLDIQQALVGITEFAQGELGKMAYVDLPAAGKSFKMDEVFGFVEAVKTTSDLFSPAHCAIRSFSKVRTSLLLKNIFGLSTAIYWDS
jgi:glycine cleavage system H protein